MTMDSDSREGARISFEVDRETHNKLNELLPWGVKALVLRMVMSMIIDAVEKGGDAALGAILTGRVELRLKPDKSGGEG